MLGVACMNPGSVANAAETTNVAEILNQHTARSFGSVDLLLRAAAQQAGAHPKDGSLPGRAPITDLLADIPSSKASASTTPTRSTLSSQPTVNRPRPPLAGAVERTGGAAGRTHRGRPGVGRGRSSGPLSRLLPGSTTAPVRAGRRRDPRPLPTLLRSVAAAPKFVALLRTDGTLHRPPSLRAGLPSADRHRPRRLRSPSRCGRASMTSS